MRKPAFKAQVDTFTANAEVVDQLEVVSKHGVSAFLGSEPQPLTSPREPRAGNLTRTQPIYLTRKPYYNPMFLST
jgi:hypothetical protein